MLVAKPSPQLEAGEANDFGKGQCQKVLEKTYVWKQKSKVILENITATRSWVRLICFHRWEQKSKVTLEKVTAKELWKRHGRNAMGCIFKPQDSSVQPMAVGSFGKDLWAA